MNNYPKKCLMAPNMNNNYMPAFQPQNMPGVPTPYTPAVPSPTQMPTGYPTGPVYSSPVTVQPYTPYPVAQVPAADVDLVPDTVQSIEYTQGFLKTQIGRKVKVEFLIGTSMLIDREGTLVDVGASYIVIRESETDDLLMADLYSIKFVKIFF